MYFREIKTHTKERDSVKKRKRAVAIILAACLPVHYGGTWTQSAFAAESAEQSAAIHDIFFAKDSSKLERFKAKVLNRILYLDTAIDVSELNIRPEEIKCQTATQELTGEQGAYYIWL